MQMSSCDDLRVHSNHDSTNHYLSCISCPSWFIFHTIMSPYLALRSASNMASTLLVNLSRSWINNNQNLNQIQHMHNLIWTYFFMSVVSVGIDQYRQCWSVWIRTILILESYNAYVSFSLCINSWFIRRVPGWWGWIFDDRHCYWVLHYSNLFQVEFSLYSSLIRNM